jgi:uncharacterized protein YciI
MLYAQKEYPMNATVLKIVLVLLGALAAQTESKAQQRFDIPKGMKSYFVGFLVRGDRSAQTLPTEELDQLMRKHLAYIRSQVEAGKYALAGPFLDSGRIAGILIINATSAEEAKQIVSSDPMVQSGRLSPEIHPAKLADLSCVRTEYEKNASR